ncbi:MAG: hypothetical protein ABJA78_02945 [Ferruginibacter sp.]
MKLRLLILLQQLVINPVTLLLFLPSLIFAQSDTIPKSAYSIAELKSDFQIFRTALEEGHPGIYRYNGSDPELKFAKKIISQ